MNPYKPNNKTYFCIPQGVTLEEARAAGAAAGVAATVDYLNRTSRTFGGTPSFERSFVPGSYTTVTDVKVDLIVTIVGAGGSGGEYNETVTNYAYGSGGGGGGGFKSVIIEDVPFGTSIDIVVADETTTPSTDGADSTLTLSNGSGVFYSLVARGGKGGETWNGMSITPPIGGSGGQSLHPSGHGTDGMSSFIGDFSVAPIITTINGGYSIESPSYGNGGNGATTSTYTSTSYGKKGNVFIQVA